MSVGFGVGRSATWKFGMSVGFDAGLSAMGMSVGFGVRRSAQRKDNKRIKNINSNLEDSTIKQLANSVLTFSDLITNRKTDYKFDLEKFTNVNGKTGLYVQYAQVRAKKLKQSIGLQKNEFDLLVLSDIDKHLLSLLFMFGYYLEQSSSLNEPHHLANYLYDISNSFNQFYEHEKLSEIKDSNHLNSKLYLIDLFLTTSKNVMFCLGIKPVERM